MERPDRSASVSQSPREELHRAVAAKQRRRLHARRSGTRGVWFGLGMFGLVGWSVAIPVVVLTAIGVWLDGRYPSRISWTLTLLGIGVVLGCVTAWSWLREEGDRIERAADAPGPPNDTGEASIDSPASRLGRGAPR